jgi:hypothetical protein
VSETLETSGQLGVWADEIRAIGNTNPLLNFEPNPFGQLDLERSHPGGLAQFVTTKSTTLSSLFREALTFSKGLAAAKRISEKGSRLQSETGLSTIYLAGGLIGLKHDGFDLNLPIVLWPAQLRHRVEDFGVAITGSPLVNPGLISSLEVSYGVKLDADRLLGILSQANDLMPLEVLEYVTSLVGPNANLEAKRLLVIGNFAVETILLQNDMPRADTALLRTLVGLDTAPADSEVDAEVQLVLDADALQEEIVAKALAGDSFSVETLPGCGYTQTVVNVLANLALAEKSVLVVTPRRQTLDELADRLASIGLAGLGIRSAATWFDIVSAISRHEKASPVALTAAKEVRANAKSQVEEYFSVLSTKNQALHASVTEILSTLATLSLMPHAPTATARISKSKLLQHQDRTAAMVLLTKAFELGEFRYGPQDTPWFGATFSDETDLQHVTDLASKLATSFDEISTAMATFVAKLNLKPAAKFEDWGTLLQLAAGVRLTLDRFVEDVYQRDLGPLMIATGPRTSRSEMSGSDRRKLRKLAKEYLRPGMHVGDLHVALTEIQEQKALWDSFALAPTAPNIVSGVGDLQVRYQAFAADLAEVQRHMDSSSESIPFARLPLRELGEALSKMSTDLNPLRNYAERAELLVELRELGLGDVSREFSRLHVQREHIAVEFDQVFWQSALEYSVAKDARILGFTAERIEVIESDFKSADAEVVSLGAEDIASKQSAAWHTSLLAHPAEALALKELLRSKTASYRALFQAAPNIAPNLASVVLASPFEVPNLVAAASFDVALVLDAAGTTIAENLAALSRAKQVVAFGDAAITGAFGFEIECHDVPIALEERDDSVFEVVRKVFGSKTLQRSWRQNGQSLGRLVNREFYQNRISFEPTASEYLGESNFSLVSVKTLDTGLEKTLVLIEEHAARSPEKSLMVGTASVEFAERLRLAVSKKKAQRPELEEFFDAHGREKFEIATIAELSHRIADGVIFSLGLESSPEILGDPNSRKFVANLLVSARSRIIAVSALDQIPEGWPLAKLLNDVFGAVAEPILDAEVSGDPMLADLALRLRKLGVRANLGFGENLELVLSYGNRAGVIQADWLQLNAPLVERLRLNPALLEAMGWKLIRVHSFELFSDPQTLALRIAISMGLPASTRQAALFEERSKDDTDTGWGDAGSSNDRRLKEDKPPHWG